MSTSNDIFLCTFCGSKLPNSLLQQTFVDCPGCGLQTKIVPFSAISKTLDPESGQSLTIEEDASCFYHVDNKADNICGNCGRFICKLCTIDLDDQKICPTCLDKGVEKKKIGRLTADRMRYDSIALSISVLSLMIWPVTFITAPAAIYYSIRHWNKPLSVLRRTKLRFILAIIFALLQIVGWGFLLYYYLDLGSYGVIDAQHFQ